MFVPNDETIEVVLYYWQPSKKYGMRVVSNLKDLAADEPKLKVIRDKKLLEYNELSKKEGVGHSAISKAQFEFNRAEENYQKAYKDWQTKCNRYKKLTLGLRPMNWKMYNDLLRSAKTQGQEEADWIGYKEKKLIMILASWDATDKNGAPMELTPENIMSLHPSMAEMAILEYDKLVYIDENEVEDIGASEEEVSTPTNKISYAKVGVKKVVPAPADVVQDEDVSEPAEVVVTPTPPANFIRDMEERKAKAEAEKKASETKK